MIADKSWFPEEEPREPHEFFDAVALALLPLIGVLLRRAGGTESAWQGLVSATPATVFESTEGTDRVFTHTTVAWLALAADDLINFENPQLMQVLNFIALSAILSRVTLESPALADDSAKFQSRLLLIAAWRVAKGANWPKVEQEALVPLHDLLLSGEFGRDTEIRPNAELNVVHQFGLSIEALLIAMAQELDTEVWWTYAGSGTKMVRNAELIPRY